MTELKAASIFRRLYLTLVVALLVLTPSLAKAADKTYPASCGAIPRQLKRQISEIWRQFPGRAGIGVRQVGCDWVIGQRLEEFFPQQSVSKLWVAAAVFDAADHKKIRLGEKIVLTRGDLSVFNQTTRAAILRRGTLPLTVTRMLEISLSQSDNISNARLLKMIGGPDVVRNYLISKTLTGIRFGPGEIPMQSAIAGVIWRPEYSYGHNFVQARAEVSMITRLIALDRYLKDPVDGATPAGITAAMSRLASGRLLSAQSTSQLMHMMLNSRTGPRRLKGGVPKDWKVYHKTGTGQALGARQTGYNDIAILEAPDGTRYAVAVMIAETESPIIERMFFIQSVSRCIVDFHKRR